MTDSSDLNDLLLSELLDRDIDRDDLRRLAEYEARLNNEPGLAEDLDELLKVRSRLSEPWLAERTAAGDNFKQRMIDSILAAPVADQVKASRVLIGPVAMAFASGLTAAAIVVISVGTFIWATSVPTEPATVAERLPSDESHWLPSGPNEQASFLKDLAVFYDGRAGWIATTGQDVQLGLVQQQVESGQPVVARLTLISPGGAPLITDLVLFPGQDAIIQAPRSQGTPVRYVLRLTPAASASGEVLLDLSADIGGGPALSTRLPLLGHQVTEVGTIASQHGKYRLHLGLVRPDSAEAI